MRHFHRLCPHRVITGAVLVALLLLGGCSSEKPQDPSVDEVNADPSVVATFRGGEVRLSDVEALLPMATMPADPQDVVALYRETAGRVALESAWRDRLEIPGETPDPSILFGSPAGRSLVDAFLERDGEPLRPSDDEIEEFFQTRREDLIRQPARRVAYIYRRHRADEDTSAYLDDVRRQHAAGTAFDQLALQHSDSETRALGGRLGWIRPGRLSPEVEAAVFALPAHGLSEPVDLPGGMAIFLISEIIAGGEFTLDELRSEIATHLYRERRRERLALVSAPIERPEGSVELDAEEFAGAVESGEGTKEILRIGAARLTLSELQAMVPAVTAVTLPAFRPESGNLERLYRARIGEALILAVALADDADAERIATQVAERIGRLERLRDIARQEIREGLTSEAIREHYELRGHRYQSVPRFKLHSLEVPLGLDPARTAASLEAARDRLAAGETDFERVRSELTGRHIDHGWVEITDLERWDQKIGNYVLQLGSVGYTVPFQLNQRLMLVWVEARDEPRPLPLEEVRERVVDDLLASRWEPLFGAWRKRALEELDFRFFVKPVEDRLEEGGRVLGTAAPRSKN